MKLNKLLFKKSKLTSDGDNHTCLYLTMRLTFLGKLYFLWKAMKTAEFVDTKNCEPFLTTPERNEAEKDDKTNGELSF